MADRDRDLRLAHHQCSDRQVRLTKQTEPSDRFWHGNASRQVATIPHTMLDILDRKSREGLQCVLEDPYRRLSQAPAWFSDSPR